MRRQHFSIALAMRLFFFIAVAGLICTGTNAAAQFTTLYHFTEGDSGYGPEGGLVADATGNLYGKALWGGSGDGGTIFELSAPSGTGAWTETVLYSFGIGQFASGCGCSLVLDSAGNLYGVDLIGVFELMRPTGSGDSWTLTYLFKFPFDDPGDPDSGLIFDQAGNLYGVTAYGGDQGRGSVYELSPPASGSADWTETVLHNFGNGQHGVSPIGNLVMIGTTLYGVTSAGGESNQGAVFKLTPPLSGETNWSESVIYSFTGAADGGAPNAGLTAHGGDLFGTALHGGDSTACTSGCGVVFQLSPSTKGDPWSETVLYSFQNGNDGSLPVSPVTFDSSGNLYATSGAGGGGSCDNGGNTGCGAIIQLAPPTMSGGAWTETTLHTFSGGNSDQGSNVSGLIFGRGQKLYGTTLGSNIGGGGDGTVFAIVP
jgi:uncharacterized repeat protein (TIGR03803 family)